MYGGQGHEHRYRGEHDTTTILPVRNGGQTCVQDSECGYGRCVTKKCKCDKLYTGPTCLVRLTT